MTLVAAISLWVGLRPASTPDAARHVVRADIADIQPLPNNLVSRAGRGHIAAISPGGTMIVFAGAGQLYLRQMDDPVAVPLRGTEGQPIETDPFFSPDEQWIGFWSEGQLKKIPVGGGAAVELCAPGGPVFGASWGPNDQIVFGRAGQGIWRVSGNGQDCRQLIALQDGEEAHGPQVLPGGGHVMYTVSPTGGRWDEGRIVVHSLANDTPKEVVPGGARYARYVASGHIVYAREGTIYAAPFELSGMQNTGGAIPLVEGVRQPAFTGASNFSISSAGDLIYLTGAASDTRSLVWVDRQGGETLVSSETRAFDTARISPDGTRIAVTIEGVAGLTDIWIFENGTFSRLTTDGHNQNPVWTWDSRYVLFKRGETDSPGIYRAAADSSGQLENIHPFERTIFLRFLTPDGGTLVGYEIDGTTRNYVALPFQDDGTLGDAAPFRNTRFNETGLKVSPDGGWLAYVSNQSGQDEVYVRPFPDADGKRIPVSAQGGTEPVWARDGTELLFRNGDAVLAVPVTLVPGFRVVGAPEKLFEGRYLSNRNRTLLDIHPETERLLMVKEPLETVSNRQIHLVLNWFEELKQRVPTGGR